MPTFSCRNEKNIFFDEKKKSSLPRAIGPEIYFQAKIIIIFFNFFSQLFIILYGANMTTKK